MPADRSPEDMIKPVKWLATCLTCPKLWDGSPYLIWHPDGVAQHTRQGHEVKLEPATDPRSPAQVAEDEEREAHREHQNCCSKTLSPQGEAECGPTHEAITRALAAAELKGRWLEHLEHCWTCRKQVPGGYCSASERFKEARA